MCMPQASVVGMSRWNWDGDTIVNRCIVPSSRPVVGRPQASRSYPIDVREFLLTEKNEVVQRTLDTRVPDFARRLAPDEAWRLKGRTSGSFDFRASMLSRFVVEKVPYKAPKGPDPWQFPDETLFVRGGDCKDRAFLLASLLIGSGISGYNVRVALGDLREHRGSQKPLDHSHAWVMYKSETGRWIVLDPHRPATAGRRERAGRHSKVHRRARAAPLAEYRPRFLVNDAHLWSVQGHHVQSGRFGTYVSSTTWRELKPRFIGNVHQSLIKRALTGLAPQWVMDGLNSQFISLFGHVIDAPDDFVAHGYDSFDHFDNGFIDESWKVVTKRLAAFKENNHARLDAFAWAAHGIADFYSHTSYSAFARDSGGYPMPFNPSDPNGCFRSAPSYDSGPYDIAHGKFIANDQWKGTPAGAADNWKGKLISGRYAQPGDSKGFLERPCPAPAYLRSPGKRMSLPHHNEIAVDEYDIPKSHRAYGEYDYHTEFARRKLAAQRHIRQAFVENWSSPPSTP